MRQPCANCPWRRDAPREHWDPQHFVDIWRTCQDDGHGQMLCHKAAKLPPAEQREMLCQGWVRVVGLDAIGVRFGLMHGAVTHDELADVDRPDLFGTFDEMLIANNVPPPERNVWFHESSPFSCPRCGRTSYNPNDARERYCGACHDWTGDAST